MDRIPVAGLIERAAYSYKNGASSWVMGLGGAFPAAIQQHFVIYFPGDRLPGSLRGGSESEDPLQLDDVDKQMLLSMSGKNTLANLTHTLDLQLPSVATDLLVGMFPRPCEPDGNRTDCVWHYLTVYPQAVSEDGFALYTQFLGKEGVTERGEPVKGAYSATPIAIPAIRSLIAEQLRRLYKDGGEIGDERLFGSVGSVHLVGFSKGGVVLNKVIVEMSSHGGDAVVGSGTPPPLNLGFHFVDCGLHTAGAFVQDRKVLDACFSSRQHAFLLPAHTLQFEVTVYTTPRQRDDPQRPWLDHERCMMLLHVGLPTVRPPAPQGWRVASRDGLVVRCLDDVFGPVPFTPLQGLRTHMLAHTRLCAHFRLL